MDAPAWLGLEPTHNPMRWMLPITPGISTGHQFLFGGCGLGAAIAALEGSSGRPVVWATAQYLSYANPPSIMDIDVTIAVAGKQVTQARAVGPRGRPRDPHGQRRPRRATARGGRPVGARCPRSRRPTSARSGCPACRATTRSWSASTSAWPTPALRRAARPAAAGGRSALWARIPDVLDMSAATLAILGDYVPFGIGQALGAQAGGNSLDNTLRVARLVPTEWVLLDIRIDAIVNGFGHGVVHLWAVDGTLLASPASPPSCASGRDAPK